MPIQVRSTPTSETTQLRNLIYDNRVIKKVQVKETPTSTPVTVFQFHIIGEQYFVANWRSSMTKAEIDSWFTDFAATLNIQSSKHVVICPPACYTEYCFNKIRQHNLSNMVAVGSQLICGEANSGSYTGQIAATQAFNTGCEYYIAGNIEQREYFGYSYSDVYYQMQNANNEGLTNFIFISEHDTEAQTAALDAQSVGLSDEQYNVNQIVAILNKRIEFTQQRFGNEMLNSIIVYEPGLNSTTGGYVKREAGQVQEIITTISASNNYKFLYGGKPSIIQDAMTYSQLEEVSGLVLDGLSLNATNFATVINQA